MNLSLHWCVNFASFFGRETFRVAFKKFNKIFFYSLQSGFCQASEVCCRYSTSKSANFILDNEFAAAAQSTSEVLTKEGYVVNVPSNQYLPQRPETEYNPDSSNDDLALLRPSTQRPVAKCSNGAPDSSYPDCCANGGRGQYCCTNGEFLFLENI